MKIAVIVFGSMVIAGVVLWITSAGEMPGPAKKDVATWVGPGVAPLSEPMVIMVPFEHGG